MATFQAGLSSDLLYDTKQSPALGEADRASSPPPTTMSRPVLMLHPSTPESAFSLTQAPIAPPWHGAGMASNEWLNVGWVPV